MYINEPSDFSSIRAWLNAALVAVFAEDIAGSATSSRGIFRTIPPKFWAINETGRRQEAGGRRQEAEIQI